MLVGSRASTLNAGLDLGKELVTLLAVAGKVGEVCAAVAGEGTDEAGKLADVSMDLLGGESNMEYGRLTAHWGMLSS